MSKQVNNFCIGTLDVVLPMQSKNSSYYILKSSLEFFSEPKDEFTGRVNLQCKYLALYTRA